MCDLCYTSIRQSYLTWLGVRFLLSALPAAGASGANRTIGAAISGELTSPARALSHEDNVRVEMTRGDWHALIHILANERALGHRHAAAILHHQLREAETLQEQALLEPHAKHRRPPGGVHIPTPRLGVDPWPIRYGKAPQ